MTTARYARQVELLLQILPIVGEQEAFALKGGTAINLFIRDMPRLSVDIDLTYLPIQSWEASLQEISAALDEMAARIKSAVPKCKILKVPGPSKGSLEGLVITTPQAQVKIEPNPVLRGSVFPCETRALSPTAQEEFGAYVEMTLLSSADIFGGKICAALDRQHPRDLFDIKYLLQKEGITDDVRRAFVVYLASHSRPMHELIRPSLLDVRREFKGEFQGMSRVPVTYEELETARDSLIRILQEELTDAERRFLLSVKSGEPDWALLPLSKIDQLPGIQWKLLNIRKMDSKKQTLQLQKLREVLVM